MRIAGGTALVVLAGIAAWAGYRAISESRSREAIEQFLARHWASPLAPQGEPPATHTPEEAALAPEACGVCHAAQLADWKTSLHSRAVGPGILWQLRTMDQQHGNDCLRCHAPLAEQKALMALERGWPNAPSAPPPAWVPGDLHLRGLSCAACHVRRHERFGPVPRADAVQLPTDARRPHGGFTADAAFSDSRFCSSCHQFPADGRSVNGKLLENTYQEWLGSRHAKEGRQCQSCHMPGRRHLWRGIHDKDMVRRALHREIRVARIDAERVRITLVLANRDAGHYLPTYVVPKIFVNTYVHGRGGQILVGQHRIGRTLNVGLDQEIADTRLPPDGKQERSYDVNVSPGEWRVRVRVEVAPGEHYERMFADMRSRNPDLDAETRRLLDEALAQALQARYYLDELEAAVPAAPGAEARTVAN